MTDNYIPWWVPADHPARATAGAGMDLAGLAEEKIKALEADGARLRERIRDLETVLPGSTGLLAARAMPPVPLTNVVVQPDGGDPRREYDIAHPVPGNAQNFPLDGSWPAGVVPPDGVVGDDLENQRREAWRVYHADPIDYPRDGSWPAGVVVPTDLTGVALEDHRVAAWRGLRQVPSGWPEGYAVPTDISGDDLEARRIGAWRQGPVTSGYDPVAGGVVTSGGTVLPEPLAPGERPAVGPGVV